MYLAGMTALMILCQLDAVRFNYSASLAMDRAKNSIIISSQNQHWHCQDPKSFPHLFAEFHGGSIAYLIPHLKNVKLSHFGGFTATVCIVGDANFFDGVAQNNAETKT